VDGPSTPGRAPLTLAVLFVGFGADRALVVPLVVGWTAGRTVEPVPGRCSLFRILVFGAAVMLTGCMSAPLGTDQVRAGGQLVSLSLDAACLDWDSCALPVLQVASGAVVETALPADIAVSVGSVPDAPWGVDAGPDGHRVLTAGVAPGRYLMFLATASGVRQFRLELS
jgi:hypothetical protein